MVTALSIYGTFWVIVLFECAHALSVCSTKDWSKTQSVLQVLIAISITEESSYITRRFLRTSRIPKSLTVSKDYWEFFRNLCNPRNPWWGFFPFLTLNISTSPTGEGCGEVAKRKGVQFCQVTNVNHVNSFDINIKTIQETSLHGFQYLPGHGLFSTVLWLLLKDHWNHT